MARPRAFDPEDALLKIKQTFWRLGYEGTSLQDIEGATGLKKQSLYRLFGDKRQMYLAALEHYEAHEVRNALKALEGTGPAKARFRALFDEIVEGAIASGDRRGCFLCNACTDQAQLDEETRKFVRRQLEAALETFEEVLSTSQPYAGDRRLRKSKAAGLMSAYFGLRVLIKGDMPESVLRGAADAAIASIASNEG
ncbi:TetR/AcrR family transcriptional regulator [Rhizobiales bacterium]|uniref:TetR/AcrR family transcriptional regulator n=1 Tax=Hongsoonwoonella zoysiae TaxID=2821844 RepID=UPI00155FAC91|nr:TetR/AcrR family transcriptional regulator [Hongsoonwoonella zoysiae]NRG17999.1 TetR/AcrR family transcriptional regulator [Hongsoonwoonella zoysiae]